MATIRSNILKEIGRSRIETRYDYSLSYLLYFPITLCIKRYNKDGIQNNLSMRLVLFQIVCYLCKQCIVIKCQTMNKQALEIA